MRTNVGDANSRTTYTDGTKIAKSNSAGTICWYRRRKQADFDTNPEFIIPMVESPVVVEAFLSQFGKYSFLALLGRISLRRL